MVTIAKAKINKLVEKQPDDSSYNEIIRELIFAQIIDRGLEDSSKGLITKHEDFKKEISSWSS
ncbi:MAG: hypothetical protein PHO37_11025 [Kiritimatiellae bacterium]|nr:hypothetical protein [Kiritimatiellia bacterium]